MIITNAPVARVNYRGGRRGTGVIDQLVIHVTEGSAESTRSWFAAPRPENPTSAHYMVTKGGAVIQFVNDEDEAYHAGRVLNPTAPLVVERPGVNPNWYSIGIEHEGSGADELTTAQRAASVELIDTLCQKHGITVDRTHIVGHHEIFSGKTCPGAISVDLLVDGVVARRALPAVVVPVRPPPPQVVFSNYFGEWLVAINVVSDGNWQFVRTSQLGPIASRATAPLSKMERPTA